MGSIVGGFRIGWLDSCRHPSRIHRTVDGGKTTICDHPVQENIDSLRWASTPEVPRKHQGRSRYCHVCFANGGKTLPWW